MYYDYILFCVVYLLVGGRDGVLIVIYDVLAQRSLNLFTHSKYVHLRLKYKNYPLGEGFSKIFNLFSSTNNT